MKTQAKTFESLFAKQTARVYASLRGRHAGKYKGDKLVRPEIPMPFTLGDFRGWVLEQFRKSSHTSDPYQNIIRCSYCLAQMDVGSFSLDHKTPWRKTMDSSFENLCLCCEQCNECKGDFSEAFYRALLEILDSAQTHNVMGGDEVSKLLSLVRMGWGYQRMAYYGRPNKIPGGRRMTLDT